MRRAQRGRDPYWLTAKYDSSCGADGCTQAVKTGDRVFYYPNSRRVMAEPCGHADKSARDFEAHRQDEDGF